MELTDKVIVVDIEANGFLPAVDTIWQVSVHDGVETRSYPFPIEAAYVQQEVDDADFVVMHNGIKYDVPVLSKCLGVTVERSKVIDTLVLSRLGKPEKRIGHSLEAWGTLLDHPKFEWDKWDKWYPETQVRCDSDTELNWKVWLRLRKMFEVMPQAVETEHAVAWACADMENVGVGFDVAAARRLLDTLLTEQEELREQALALLPKVYKTKGNPKALKNKPNRAHWAHGNMEAGSEFQEVQLVQLQPGSRDDITLYLQRTYGWKPTQKTKTGKAQVNDDVLRALPWPEAEVFADYFKVEKLLGYLNGEVNKSGKGGGWLQHVRDGSIHAGWIPLTAVTGRPSCVAPNLQQVSTDERARSLFVAREGRVLVGIDIDGQELRNLGHYLWPHDNGEYAREVVEGDIHTKVQRLIGFHTRDITKNVEYSLIYGAGNPKLGLYALKDCVKAGLPMPKINLARRGKEMRQAIMRGIPAYEKLANKVRAAALQRKTLKGLDGRSLWVRSAHSALNLLLQSAGIIHMKRLIMLMRPTLEDAGFVYGRDWTMVLWVHDEVQLECAPDKAQAIGDIVAGLVPVAAKQVGLRPEYTGGVQIGATWRETH